MKYITSPFAKAFIFALGYGICFYILQFFFVSTGMLPALPSASTLHGWDVGFYDSIRQNGYNESEHSTGFFILFPLIWRLSGLGIWGISFFNIIIFALGFGLLTRVLQEDRQKFWLFWLTLPSVYFAFIPYTESLFFLLSTLILYAIKEKEHALLWISLLLISLVRATGIILLPAFIAMELLANPTRFWWKSILKSIYKYALPMAIGMAIFIYWQYVETGIWFAYFKKQATHWGHTFSLPGIPFSNIENANWRYHWLSALAMFVNTIALGYLLRQFILWLKNKNQKNNILILSTGYLTMILMTLLFLNPKYGGTLTNVMGANRYTFITPFFFVFMHYIAQQKYSWKQILYVFLFANIFWILFGAYHTLNNYIIIALINNFLIVAFLLYASHSKYNWTIIPIIAFNFFVQLHLFQQFITPLYVD